MAPHFSCSLMIVVGIALSQCGSTQFAQSTQNDYGDSVRSPLFMTWSSTMWNIFLALPGLARPRTGREGPSKCSFLLGGSVGLPPLGFLLRVLFFYIAWLAANYCYQRALRFMSASLVATLFSTAPAFVAVGSLLFLGRHLPPLGWAAVACSMLGSVMVAEPWQHGSTESSLAVGCFFAILAALAAAAYKVGFKLLFGEPTPETVGIILAWIGICAATLGTVLLSVVLATGSESVKWADVPWVTLMASNSLSLFYNFLIGWGIAISNPLFISLGTVLNVPLNLLVDSLFRAKLASSSQALGMAFVLAGFVMLLYCDLRDRGPPATANRANSEAECQGLAN